MPRRDDISTVMIIGAGPIVIGQACEFDYSGTQACKALKEEGYRVVLINSNPATVMTDPGFADRTYIEPVSLEAATAIIEIERPDAILPTMGGQTALNLAIELDAAGVFERYGVEMIGAGIAAVRKAEDRDQFKAAMEKLGLDLPGSGYARSVEEGLAVRRELGLPLILRPSRTLGGSGADIAYGDDDFETKLRAALDASPVGECLVEESVEGWKEFELEVMRDSRDNVVIICSIENFDAMGVHTGDSITVAPAQTLSDKEYQRMRDAAIAIIREIGVDTGGSNVQFGVNPRDGRLVVIEMNPRVSRSSALASKATGFPIAKMAAKLAVGFTLDEIRNDITRETPASFEPSIDYVVTKVPRFTFEKFEAADDRLTSQMKSVGEAMAIGRTFRESLHKAMRSLETGSFGFEGRDEEDIESRVAVANSQRPWYLAEALRRGWSVEKIHDLSGIDPWFLRNIEMIIEVEGELTAAGDKLDRDLLARARRDGFADVRVAALTGLPVEEVAAMRTRWGLKPAFKTVDTCAAEFEAFTPYLYSTSEEEDEAPPSDRRKIVILGGGPNRIGQGIEFDYCCVHASFALKEAGYETIMINCNPETVSTDYDTSDRLDFEPLTHEDVLAIVQREKPDGVIVQFGGQTPLGLARGLEAAGVPVIGTSPDSIDLAEDRERFQALLKKLDLKQPPGGIARSVDEAEKIALSLGLPVLVRPSYVLGGRGMQIVYEESQLREFAARAMESSPGHPLLIDKFLNQAIEVDVDSVCDGERVVIGGIMEHIEQAGVHSGDSACSLPPWSLAADVIEEISRQTRLLALEIGVLGLMNVQFAVVGSEVFILEVNPRASRTVPFVSKATGVQLAKIAARVMAGESLVELGFTEQVIPPYVSVKEAVFPFLKFAGVDTLLGPEMKSTGEVMGIAPTFGEAFAKAQLAGGTRLPTGGTALVSVRREDKVFFEPVARSLVESGLGLVATSGTADYLRGLGIDCEAINKVYEGSPHTVDIIEEGRVQLVINTSSTPQSVKDSYSLRRSALEVGVPYFTTPAGAAAAAAAIAVLKPKGTPTVYALQDLHAELPGRGEAG